MAIKKARLIKETGHESMYKENGILAEKPYVPNNMSMKDFNDNITKFGCPIYVEAIKSPIVVDSNLFIPINDRILTTANVYWNKDPNPNGDIFVASRTFKDNFPKTSDPLDPEMYFPSIYNNDLYEIIESHGLLYNHAFYVYGFNTFIYNNKSLLYDDKNKFYIYLVPLNFDKMDVVIYCHACGKVEILDANIHNFFSELNNFVIDKKSGKIFHIPSEIYRYKTKDNKANILHECNANHSGIIQIIGFFLNDFWMNDIELLGYNTITFSLYDRRLFSSTIFEEGFYSNSSMDSSKKKNDFYSSLELASTIETNIYEHNKLYYTDVIPDELYSKEKMNSFNECCPRILLPHYAIKNLINKEKIHQFMQHSSMKYTIKYER